ncbi:MAG: acetate kinase, partial [Caldilineaceae bacterium]|nr:acetate kinase [Caldilineaceae bacterium]
NGCSAAAVLDGRSVDTTMGLTPLEGLVMGTRSGDVDPSLHEFLGGELGVGLAEVTAILNKKSGLLGLSGLNNDMRSLEAAAAEGHEQARIAIDVFCYRLAKYLAALAVPLGRLDAIIFTGGIGENSAFVRAQTLSQLAILGVRVDDTRNQNHGRRSDGVITQDGSTVALVVPTNEEAMIAADTIALVR